MSQVKINVEEDCGNAPKKIQIRDFNIAYATGDVEHILDQVSDDITWHMVGESEIHGKDDFAAALEDMTDVEVAEVNIEHVITHGDTGAVNGRIVLSDGGSVSFCDIYTFSSHGKNAKIKQMTSYVIEA